MIKILPQDSILIKTERGYLLVSPQNALYCAIFPDEHDETAAHLKDSNHPLSACVQKRIEAHGFYNGPRPLRPAHHLLQFQVTNACNLRCVYCSACSGHARAHELSLIDICRVIDEALEIDPQMDISFTGGEPLLVPWIMDAIDYAAERMHPPVLLSNLLLCNRNESLLTALADRMKSGLRVQMSMSGTDRDVCNRLSGRECYDEGIEVLHKFKAHGVLPTLDLIMSAPDSQANVDAFAEFRRSLPEDLNITIGFMYSCGRENGTHVFTSHADAESFLDDVTFEGGVCVPGQQPTPVTERRLACSCVENENLFIRSDGGIYSCFKMVECFGHIRDGLKNVIDKRRRECVMAAQLPLCRSCPFVNMCASGCRADNIMLSGSTKAPICGPWRKNLIAEMLFEDCASVFDWTVIQQLTEARRRGFKTPDFVITEVKSTLI